MSGLIPHPVVSRTTFRPDPCVFLAISDRRTTTAISQSAAGVVEIAREVVEQNINKLSQKYLGKPRILISLLEEVFHLHNGTGCSSPIPALFDENLQGLFVIVPWVPYPLAPSLQSRNM
jgi:hypothetical protein